MGDSKPSARWRSLRARLLAFVLDRHPLALEAVTRACDRALESLADQGELEPVEGLEILRQRLREETISRLEQVSVEEIPDPTPGVGALERLGQGADALLLDLDGFLRRESIRASFTDEERRELLAGMVLTRAVDNRLKQFFLGGEVRWQNKSFQGKGFRSLGQEAIYAACLRLRRGDEHRDPDGTWHGDVVAPLIRDAGAALGMHPEPSTVRMILSAQMAKAGPPMDGRDLHVGDFSRGILPPAAPLSISALNAAGLAFAMKEKGEKRVAVTFIGEGGSSLGEWHEAINACAARRLPAVFCIENNQTALSTPLEDQTSVRAFADKAAGYGIPGLTIDGTDPEAIAAAFAWAAERARRGDGPTLVELVCLRMCGHAHHDDMLYVGKEPALSWDYPELLDSGYADPDAWAFWSAKDPIGRYAERLEAEGLLDADELDEWKREAEALVETEAEAVIAAPWPDPSTVGHGVFAEGPAVVRRELLDPRPEIEPGLPEVEAGTAFDPGGSTFLEAIQLGVRDALLGDERVFVYGEDVGGEYGNAFLLLRPLLESFGERIVNSPLSEAATLGVATGAALGGCRPIAEIQFNDFVATGFNQLVNNAAKIRYRWGASVPMVVRMPWGGLRSAGPYHSQNTEPWFYRTPGLKIVVPSTPEDARALLLAAVADPDPVLFYEHIGLYRDPKIKQPLAESVASSNGSSSGAASDGAAPGGTAPNQSSHGKAALGRAALRRAGSDLLMVSYGAYVHRALAVAEILARDGIEAAVLDLRCLVPLDRETLVRCAAHCHKVLIVHEDSRTGSIGESLAAIIQEEAFEYLDAPVRVLAALDTPVPYAPPLEQAFLPSLDEVERAARLLVDY